MSFLELQPDVFGEIYPVVVDNADRHFRIAGLLSQEGEYGNAIPHLIMGSEEFLKAVLFLMEFKGFNFRKSKEISKILYDNGAGHALFKELFAVWIALKPIIEMSASDKKISIVTIAQTILKAFDGGALGHQSHAWWAGADQLKQNGFYVNHHKSLSSPADYAVSDYETALHHCSLLRSETLRYINALALTDVESLSDLRQLFLESDIQDLIERSVKRAYAN